MNIERIEITPQYLASQGLSPTFPERFWSKVNKSGPVQKHCPELGPCWIWIGAGSSGGKALGFSGRYGSIGGKFGTKRMQMIRAHIASWILHFGPVPEGMKVCHGCDVGRCVRPEHLWIGTHAQNMADMVSKHRERAFVGEAHTMAKLTWTQVDEIRASYSKTARNGQKLATKFGVTCGHIHDVVNHVVWNK